MEKRMQQEQSSPPQVETTPKKKKRIGKKGKWLLLILILAVAAGFLAIRHLGRQQTSAAVSYQEATVETRDITRSLTASGTLEPADSYTVSTLVDGEILGDTFEEGDLVEKGQLLYTLDSSDASSALTQSQNSYIQERPWQDPGQGQGKAEEGNRRQPAVGCYQSNYLHGQDLDQTVV